jgi:hypothetical protein
MRALGAFCLGLCPSTALKQKVNRREKIVNTHSNDIVISFKLLPKLQADSRKSKRNNWIMLSRETPFPPPVAITVCPVR